MDIKERTRLATYIHGESYDHDIFENLIKKDDYMLASRYIRKFTYDLNIDNARSIYEFMFMELSRSSVKIPVDHDACRALIEEYKKQEKTKETELIILELDVYLITRKFIDEHKSEEIKRMKRFEEVWGKEEDEDMDSIS